jgi:hypothetical protein
MSNITIPHEYMGHGRNISSQPGMTAEYAQSSMNILDPNLRISASQAIYEKMSNPSGYFHNAKT